MNNVVRTPIPITLTINAETWTDNLLAAIDNFRNSDVKIPKTTINKYKKKGVLDALKQMYSDGYGSCFCCYCERPIEEVGYPHIEHRKPKEMDLFPEEAFKWDNLHLACEKCNKKKGTQWDYDNEILDAVEDTPIEDHLGYEIAILEGIYVKTLSARGITTEKHTDLNRKPLRIARARILESINDSIEKIKSSHGDPRNHTAKQRLLDKCNGIHGSLITWALKNADLI